MRLRILGCHGGESPAHRATCFMVDDVLLLDVGSVTRGLSVEEQLAIDWVYISHAHLDHVRDLGLLADNIFGQRKTPVEVYCSEATSEGIKQSYFNNTLWPDFFVIPNPSDPEKNGMLRLHHTKNGESIEVGPYTVEPILVSHSIECHGCIVRDATGATLVYSGDTGPTERLWDAVNKVEDLRGFIFEVSFPNEMEELATVSGHHTPRTMFAELDKYQPKNLDAPVFIYGMKPGYTDTLKEQIAGLKDSRLTILKPMDEFVL